MAKKNWTLTDTRQGTYVDQIAITPGDVGGSATGYSVAKRRLRGGRSDGVDLIEIDNGAFRFAVIPTRGMGVWQASCGDLQLGWKSPAQGPVHPSLVPLCEGSGLGWLDGFDEMLVRCGLESNGAPVFDDNGALRYPLHGKIANIPAHQVALAVDGDSGEITLTGVVDETRLFFNKLRLTSTYTTKVGQPGFTVTDTVENISAEPGELELLYHINFGVPLIGPGAKVVLPLGRCAPRDAVAVGNLPEWDTYGPETPGMGEACFFFDLADDEVGQTQALLKNAAGDRGVSLRFNKAQLPCFTLWKNRQAAIDGYVTGLEPATNFPNPRTFEKEKGRVVVLQPGESRTFAVTLEAHPDAAGVAAAEQVVARLGQGVTPEVLGRPDPEWSPA
jgi:galactose mutarotase-like enzyme